MSHKAKLQFCAALVRLLKIRFPSQGQQSVLLVSAVRNWIHPFPEELLHRGTAVRHVPWLFLELHLSYKSAISAWHSEQCYIGITFKSMHMKSHHFFPSNLPAATKTAEIEQKTVKATVSYTLMTFPSHPQPRWKFSLLLNIRAKQLIRMDAKYSKLF